METEKNAEEKTEIVTKEETEKGGIKAGSPLMYILICVGFIVICVIVIIVMLVLTWKQAKVYTQEHPEYTTKDLFWKLNP